MVNFTAKWKLGRRSKDNPPLKTYKQEEVYAIILHFATMLKLKTSMYMSLHTNSSVDSMHEKYDEITNHILKMIDDGVDKVEY